MLMRLLYQGVNSTELEQEKKKTSRDRMFVDEKSTIEAVSKPFLHESCECNNAACVDGIVW